MRLRYWLLLIGSVLAVIGGAGVDLDAWRFGAMVGGGGLIGVWAFEGVREKAREQGIDMEPW